MTYVEGYQDRLNVIRACGQNIKDLNAASDTLEQFGIPQPPQVETTLSEQKNMFIDGMFSLVTDLMEEGNHVQDGKFKAIHHVQDIVKLFNVKDLL